MTTAPFANGSEVEAWTSCWCDHCAHDHTIHLGDGPGCDLMLHAMLPDDFPWPEAWAAAPDFWRHLPARIACLKFEPCEPCGGDPGADERPAHIESIRVDMRRNQRVQS